MLLYIQDSAGNYSIASDDQKVAAALLVLDSVIRHGSVLDNPRAVKQYLMMRFARLEHEVFAMILLDTRRRVIDVEELFRGTIDGAVVYPREVLKTVFAHNAAAVILVHNHPSGVPEPSEADEQLTRQLKAALALIDVRVLDHLIIGHNFVESFAERGLL